MELFRWKSKSEILFLPGTERKLHLFYFSAFPEYTHTHTYFVFYLIEIKAYFTRLSPPLHSSNKPNVTFLTHPPYIVKHKKLILFFFRFRPSSWLSTITHYIMPYIHTCLSFIAPLVFSSFSLRFPTILSFSLFLASIPPGLCLAGNGNMSDCSCTKEGLPAKCVWISVLHVLYFTVRQFFTASSVSLLLCQTERLNKSTW